MLFLEVFRVKIWRVLVIKTLAHDLIFASIHIVKIYEKCMFLCCALLFLFIIVLQVLSS